MASVTIRNIGADVIAALKAQAQANHRSLEREIRHVLSQLAFQPRRVEEFRERTARLSLLTAGVHQSTALTCSERTASVEGKKARAILADLFDGP